MDIAAQLDGERIAREIVAQSKARELLDNPSRPFSQWHYWLLLLLVSTAGGFIASYSGPHNQLVLSTVVMIAVSLAAAAFLEGIRNRRRLDAVLVLLRANQR
ncbi:MAG: hypothetical protein WA777_03765 [Rhodanobacter sp.]